MKRLDWQLVRPPRAGADQVLQLDRRIQALVARAAQTLLADDELELLVELEGRYDEQTVPPCEAVGAPKVEDDPDWEARAVDEYGDSESELELEEFLDLRRTEPDCDRCPYASPYSVFPMDPCEFSAGPLLYLVDDAQILGLAIEGLGPPQMRELAERIDDALAMGRWNARPELDTADYLQKASFFLRFWSRHGFAMRPLFFDDEPQVLTPDGPVGGPGESSDPSPILH